MKKVLLFAGFALGLALSANAQAPASSDKPMMDDKMAGHDKMMSHDKMTGRHGMDKMKKDLGLTDDQAAKMSAIMMETKSQEKMIHNDAAMSKDDKMSKMKECKMMCQDKAKAVLTPDQYTKYMAMQSKMKGGHKMDKMDKME